MYVVCAISYHQQYLRHIYMNNSIVLSFKNCVNVYDIILETVKTLNICKVSNPKKVTCEV